MSTTAAVAPAQPPVAPGEGVVPASRININPENVDAELDAMFAPPVSSAPSAPVVPPVPPVVPPGEPAAPAPVAGAPPVAAPVETNAQSLDPTDDLPDRFRINRAKMPDEESWEAVKMMKTGMSFREASKVLAERAANGTGAPEGTPPGTPAPAVDPVVAATAKVEEIQAQLATAIGELNTPEQARLTAELQRAVIHQDRVLTEQAGTQAAAQTRLEQLQADAETKTFDLYPELAQAGSVYHLKSIEIHKQNLADGRPIVNDPGYLKILADETALALGDQPRFPLPSRLLPRLRGLHRFPLGHRPRPCRLRLLSMAVPRLRVLPTPSPLHRPRSLHRHPLGTR